MTTYGKPTWALLPEALADLTPPYQIDQIIGWFRQHYPRLTDGTVRAHVIALTANDPSKRHHPAYRTKRALLYKIGRGSYEPYDPSRHGWFDQFGERTLPPPGTPIESPIAAPADMSADAVDAVAEEAEEAQTDFVLERYLEEFLLSNWTRVNWGRRLKLDDADGPESGHQRSTPVGRIDFLCVDLDTNALVAVELKRGRPSDQVVGQVARYLGWLREHRAQPGQAVEGVVIAHDISDKLRYAASAVPGVSLLEYRVDFSLARVPTGGATG
jgi:hypothetical protein